MSPPGRRDERSRLDDLSRPDERCRRVAVLSVGDELLAGELVDSNAAWLAAQVRARGHRVVTLAAVGDEIPAIAAAVRRASQQPEPGAELLLVTGGLGPTKDDVTREGIAAAFGLELAEDPVLLAELKHTYARAGRELGESSRRQAAPPAGSTPVPNPVGTAPGFVVSTPGLVVAALPGVPSEMRALAGALLPTLLPEQPALQTRTVLAAGMPEAAAGEAIADLMEHAGPHREDLRVGITASLGVLSITVRGNDAAAVERTEQDVRRRLGPAVFGKGGQTLAGVVVAELIARRQSLTIAESCTGGLLAAAITSVPGSSAVFRESVVAYSDEAKTARLGVPAQLLQAEGAVSEPVALAMARGARQRAAADFAVAISGIAGPDGGTPEKPVGTIVITVCDARGEQAQTFHWKGTRDELRARTVSVALDRLRRRLASGAGSPG